MPIRDGQYLEDKIDQMAADIAFLKGQWSAIPPADLVKLGQRIAASEARILSISGFLSLLIAGFVSFFFKGGSHS